MRVKLKRCRSCGHELDAATAPGRDAAPSPGDFSICLHCGDLQAFDANMDLVDLDADQVRDVAGDPEILAIMRARGKVVSGEFSRGKPDGH